MVELNIGGYSQKKVIVFLNYENLKKLLWGNYGDVLLLKGRRGKEFACIVLPDDAISKRAIGINRMIRDRPQVRGGDIVTIKNGANIKCEKKISVSPTDTSVNIRYDVFRGIP